MQIQINKDLEEAYKDEIIKGFSIREAVYLGISVGLIGGITAFAYFRFGIMPDTGIYLGIPFAIPVLLMGFYKTQGLTLAAYLKEIIYEQRTKILLYDADELPPEFTVFTMERRLKQKKKGGWKR